MEDVIEKTRYNLGVLFTLDISTAFLGLLIL